MGISINGGNGDYNIRFTSPQGEKANGTKEVVNTTYTPIITTTNKTTRADLAGTITDVTGKAQLNAPTASGLPPAEDVCKGNLVSGYHFDDLGPCNLALFTIKYNSANTPRIANETSVVCDNIDNASAAANIQNPNGPFAELFT